MPSKKAPLTPFLLIMIILSTILSIRNWAFLVEYGFASLIYLLIAVAVFFIPVSLVSAELASGWPEEGGVYVWIREALGKKAAFLSIWFFWISNVVWYPTILSFVTCTLFYSIAPQLAANPFWVTALIFLLFWAIVLGNLFGIRYASWFGTVAFIFGTFLPGIAMIAMGAIWLGLGKHSHIDFSLASLIPTKANLGELIFLVSIVLSFAGMEMNAIHAKDVKDPKRNFPRAIAFSALVIVLLTTAGIFSIGIVIPKEKISLTAASMEAISQYLTGFGYQWLLIPFSLCIALGALGGISSWLIGTSKGLLFAVREEGIPSQFLKLNQHNVPTSLLLLQAAVVSFLALLFVMMPSLNGAFWILTALASQLYLITYIMMFISGIVLRFKYPFTSKGYSIPGKKLGMCLASGLGIASSIFAFLIGFVPPQQIEITSIFSYELFLILGLLLSIFAPLLFLRRRTKSILPREGF